MGTSESSLDTTRVALAGELLQEAVYRSRGEQAGAALLRARGAGTGNCGLGEKAAVVLDLTPRAEVVFGELFPAGLASDALARLRDVLGAWVMRQDALDRRRNHFLKDFRQRHGFDRDGYGADDLARFEAGLERINAEAAAERAAAARELLERAAREPRDP
jgi:hypothetical protein